jgi:hypothetical protein
MAKRNPLENHIPEIILQRLGQAVSRGQLALTVIISPEILASLNAGKVDMADVEGVGVVVFVPQALVDRIYGDAGKN